VNAMLAMLSYAKHIGRRNAPNVTVDGGFMANPAGRIDEAS